MIDAPPGALTGTGLDSDGRGAIPARFLFVLPQAPVGGQDRFRYQ